MDLQTGDIVMTDSDKFGPRMVKFLMTAPTVWQHIWRKLRGTQEKVKYYHLAMMLDKENKIEQQWKVQIKAFGSVPSKGCFIARYKKATPLDFAKLRAASREDIGKNWDILNVLGKTLTWLTGIPLFAQFIQWPDQNICVNRVADWYNVVFKYKFGALTIEELTTHNMYKWIKNHPEDFDVLVEN